MMKLAIDIETNRVSIGLLIMAYAIVLGCFVSEENIKQFNGVFVISFLKFCFGAALALIGILNRG